MYPKSFFDQYGDNPISGTCFVIMPFDSAFNDVYATISETLKGKVLNFTCTRADEIFGGGHIIEDILNNIGKAEIIIADLTGRNPNVFYELGITHMIKNVEKVLVLTQDISDIPFDLKQYRCLQYEQSKNGLQKLRDDLEKTIPAITRPVYRFNIGMEESYEFSTKLPGEDRAAYYFVLSQVDVGQGYAKFRYKPFRFSRGQTTEKDGNFYMLHQGEAFPIYPTEWLLLLENVSIVDNRAHFKVIVKNSERVRRIIPIRDDVLPEKSEGGKRRIKGGERR